MTFAQVRLDWEGLFQNEFVRLIFMLVQKRIRYTPSSHCDRICLNLMAPRPNLDAKAGSNGLWMGRIRPRSALAA